MFLFNQITVNHLALSYKQFKNHYLSRSINHISFRTMINKNNGLVEFRGCRFIVPWKNSSSFFVNLYIFLEIKYVVYRKLYFFNWNFSINKKSSTNKS